MFEALVRLKKNLPFLWVWIESLNGFLFDLFYGKSLCNALALRSQEVSGNGLVYRPLDVSDIEGLYRFLSRQDEKQFSYFKPHEFDRETLSRLLRNPAFIMLGVFDGESLAGYFFLRCFVNRKCFNGRIVDGAYQGKGIAKNMARILVESAWSVGFRVFSTISKKNEVSLGSYKSICSYSIVKELSNGYLLVEYIKPGNGAPASFA